MTARAEAAAATGERILDACIELFWERISDQFTLEEIATRSGVTVQTVLRRFGSKEGVFTAAVEKEQSRIAAQRGAVQAGDLTRIVVVLIDHYEEMGDFAIRLLAEEGRNAVVDQLIAEGRRLHWQWSQTVFDPFLANLTGDERHRRLAQFVTVCDVYTWKLLHHDAGLSRAETELALRELLAPLTKE